MSDLTSKSRRRVSTTPSASLLYNDQQIIISSQNVATEDEAESHIAEAVGFATLNKKDLLSVSEIVTVNDDAHEGRFGASCQIAPVESAGLAFMREIATVVAEMLIESGYNVCVTLNEESAPAQEGA